MSPHDGQRTTETDAPDLAKSSGAATGGGSLAVLELLARAAGVPFDITRAQRALRQAEADVSPNPRPRTHSRYASS